MRVETKGTYDTSEAVTTVAGSLHTLTVHQSGTTVVDLSELTGNYNISNSEIHAHRTGVSAAVEIPITSGGDPTAVAL